MLEISGEWPFLSSARSNSSSTTSRIKKLPIFTDSSGISNFQMSPPQTVALLHSPSLACNAILFLPPSQRLARTAVTELGSIFSYRYLIPVTGRNQRPKKCPTEAGLFMICLKIYIVQITSPPLTSGGLVMYSAIFPKIS